MSKLAVILDRFDDDLEVARQRVKDQLTALVDARFDQLKADVNVLRNRVLKKQADLPSNQLANEWPEPVSVTFENYKAAREARRDVQPPDEVLQATPCTSG